MTKVLLVEDDIDLGNLLTQYLELNKFEVNRVYNGLEARQALENTKYDIGIFDVMMPKEDGFVLATRVKEQYPYLPFIFLTARKMKDDIIQGLKLGADDYIVKPFDADELILRIQNILKRTARVTPVKKPESKSYILGSFTFDPDNLKLTSSTTNKTLTEKEAQLLDFLFQHKNQLIKKEDILNHLWQETDFFTKRSLDVFISRLRKYLADDKTIQITSVRGVGYRFTGV